MRNVLFLCTANSARSIIAEALLNHLPATTGKVRAFSAGSQPRGAVHPMALELLREHGIPTDSLHSKSWSEFSGSAAPRMDYVITVCDNAAAEVCPTWPGHPVTAHWSIPDPAVVDGSAAEQRQAFRRTFELLRERIETADFAR